MVNTNKEAEQKFIATLNNHDLSVCKKGLDKPDSGTKRQPEE